LQIGWPKKRLEAIAETENFSGEIADAGKL
jgi:hypothetical protein